MAATELTTTTTTPARSEVIGEAMDCEGGDRSDSIPVQTKWYDRRDCVVLEFCVADSNRVNINYEEDKITFSCLGSDCRSFLNVIELYDKITISKSSHKRTDRTVVCIITKKTSGKSWPRLTKDKTKLSWLSVDFGNWKDWEDDSGDDLAKFNDMSDGEFPDSDDED
ncbi:prostaglandin E synthase 3-like [Petromyzon marinus]|uniref:Prostaglandin E synthase 3-like n=1 Tax=Petromyzon marinus TaxID=7757 RepID=A0AAJ7X6E3_PETMA|nr:prostaglandin E synthase 3-like [Petromyzon marinus]